MRNMLDLNSFSLLLLIVWLITLQRSESSENSSREDICLSALPENYDRFSPPHEQGKPTDVFIKMEILDLDEIHEADMDFRLHAFIRAVWNDRRLLENRFSMHGNCFKHIWTPDLIFEEAKVIIDIGQHSIFFAIREDHVYFSQRYSFKVTCKMDFHLYPFDTQRCIFSIAFMATDDSKAILKWYDDEKCPYKNVTKTIILAEDIAPLQFHVETPTLHSIVKKFQFTNFTYIWATIPLTRRLTGSLVNHYMPSALLVIMSWITFWLQGEAASERITLIMTALLTICTQSNQYKSELPPMNYITALDIWFFVCTFMIFATLVEFAFSYNSYRKQKMEKSLKEKDMTSSGLSDFSNHKGKQDVTVTEDIEEKSESELKGIKKLLQMDETTKLDSISKIVFPSSFLLFFSIYWGYYIFACNT